MEALIRDGLVDAVLDITTTELADEQVGGAGDNWRAPAALGLQVDQRRASRTGRGADGSARQGPGREQ